MAEVGKMLPSESIWDESVGVGVVGRGRGLPPEPGSHGIEALLTPDTIATGYTDSPSLPLWWSELAWQAHCTASWGRQPGPVAPHQLFQ